MKQPAHLSEKAALALLNESFPIGRSAFRARVADGSIPRVHYGGRKIFYERAALEKFARNGKSKGA